MNHPTQVIRPQTIGRDHKGADVKSAEDAKDGQLCRKAQREPEQDSCDDDDDDDDDIAAANEPSHPGDQAPNYWSWS